MAGKSPGLSFIAAWLVLGAAAGAPAVGAPMDVAAPAQNEVPPATAEPSEPSGTVPRPVARPARIAVAAKHGRSLQTRRDHERELLNDFCASRNAKVGQTKIDDAIYYLVTAVDYSPPPSHRIVTLCNAHSSWRKLLSDDAIKEIEQGLANYFTCANDKLGMRIGVVRQDGHKPFLRTWPNKQEWDNLEALPACEHENNQKTEDRRQAGTDFQLRR